MTYLLITSFIAGILLSSLFPVALPTAALLFVFAGLLAVVILFRREPFVFKLSTCVLLFLVGVWRYQSAVPQIDSTWIQSLNDGSEATLTGQILSVPEVVGNTQRLEAGHLRLDPPDRPLAEEADGRELKGKILLKTRRYPEYHYGDEIEITDILKTPPEFEDFSYRNYLATRGIYSLMDYPEITLLSSENGNRIYAALLNFRVLVEEKIGRILPEPESSLLAGVLLGVKRNLPPDFYEALQKSGTLHVVVVSGTNITYAIAALLAISGFLARPARLTFATLGILAYALIVGGGSAVWRSTLMGLTVLLAAALGRRRLAQEALFLSAAVLLLANPLGLWQIGFQLSFAASAGIIFLQDLVSSKLQALTPLIRRGLVTTLAAQIGVLPIIIHNFQTLSIVSPLSNLLTFLLVPLITVIGAVVSFIALIYLPLGKLFAPLVFVPAKLFVTIVELSARVPLAQVKIPKIPVFVWWVYYLVLMVFVIRDIQKTQNDSADQ